MSGHHDPLPSSQRPLLPWRTALLLFLFLNCVYLLTSSGRVRSIDEIDPVMQSESLLLRHSTAIPQAMQSGIYFGKLDVHGVPRSAWPVGHSLLVLPWAAFGHHVLSHLPGVPREIRDLAVSTAVCWSNASYAAWAVTAAFLLFIRLGVKQRAALATALLMAFATPLFVYAGWLYTEPVTVAILITAALLLLTSPEDSRWQPLGGVALLAFSMHLRPANTVMVALFLVAVALREHRLAAPGFRYRMTATLAAAAFLSGLLYLTRNQMLFGSPFDFGVPATAEGGKDLDSWHNPLLVGLFGFLFSPGKSALLFCPLIVPALCGLPRLWQRNRALAFLSGALPLVSLFFYSVRTQWEGGYCWGPRYLVPGLLVGMLPLAVLLEESPRWLPKTLAVLASLGVLVQLLGIAVNPLEDMVRNHYFVGNWDYRMSYSPLTGQLALLVRYLQQPPRALGLGWDRWFYFLHAAGASALTVNTIAVLFALGAALSGSLLWRRVRAL